MVVKQVIALIVPVKIALATTVTVNNIFVNFCYYKAEGIFYLKYLQLCNNIFVNL